MASAADAPQMATAPPVSVPNALPSFSARASAMPASDREGHAADHDRDRHPAERAHLVDRDAQPQKRHADAQHVRRGDLDARPAACPPRRGS